MIGIKIVISIDLVINIDYNCNQKGLQNGYI